jgi:outer membrane protein OmpA-like peptidoglycan-associated protein
MGYRPGRWLVGLLPLTLVGVAAYQINTARMETALERDAASALAGIGAQWATVQVDGRDARIEGAAPDEAAARAVADAVAGVYGVRRVDAAAVTIAPPPPPKPADPDITAIATDPPAVSGTFDAAAAKSLAVAIGTREFRLGSDPELTADGNAWRLKPGALADGVYDVAVTTTDAAGAPTRIERKAALTIDTPPPAAPTVDSRIGNDPAAAITGRWTPRPGDTLTVTVAGRSFTLGKDDALTADSSGRWSLVLTPPLADGAYDVSATVIGAGGKRTADAGGAKVVIDTAPPVAPAAPVVKPWPGPPAPLVITGTYPAADAASLAVSVAGDTWRLGEAASPLTAEGDDWTLSLRQPLPDGAYDVTVEVSDAAGNVARTAATVRIAPAALPLPPTISILSGSRPEVSLSGTVSPGASELTVTVGGLVHRLGEANGPALDPATGAWTLALAAPLPPGDYTVTVDAKDAAGTLRTATTQLVITAAATETAAPAPDTRSPPLPTVNPVSGVESRPTITGTWPEEDAASFTVAVDGQTYVMGETPALARPGPGRWSLTPAMPLPAGSHDVVATVKDAAGNVSTDVSRFEVRVKQPEAPVPAAPPVAAAAPAADCQLQFAALLSAEQIRFASDSVALSQASDRLLGQLAAVAQSCPGSAVVVAGFTDATGSDIYNQALSEGRAAEVVKRLVRLGVDPGRLAAEGYGAANPVAPNDTPEGRALNRRIEFRVQP